MALVTKDDVKLGSAPNLVMDYEPDMSPMNTKHLTKHSVGNPALCIEGSDLLNLRPSKFGQGGIFALRLEGSIFHHLVPHVVIMRTSKKVRRITARRIVTGMANIQSIWDRAVSKFIGTAMGGGSFTVNGQCAVTVGVTTTHPRPTGIRPATLINPTPKVSNGIGDTVEGSTSCGAGELGSTPMRINLATYGAGSWGTCYNRHSADLHERLVLMPGMLIASPGLSVPIIPHLGGSQWL